MDFSVMFWGDVEHGHDPNDKYRLMLDVARYADENDYVALWVPERHFHPWGGHFPNPSLLCSALAATTRRIRLRAGSVVLPLHNPIRVAEEWSIVDNLSGGRAEIAVASGWKDDDFVLAPEIYERRREAVWDHLDTVQALWKGEKHRGRNGRGQDIEVSIYPAPIQPELPVWITSAGGIRTMTDAGSAGFNLLTHLLGQTFDDVQKKIQQYNAYRARAGLEERGKVALMLHTFLGEDVQRVKETVKPSLKSYLRQSADLAVSNTTNWNEMDPVQVDGLIELAFERYFETASLIGTPTSCRSIVERAASIGVTEICCLVDFGLDAQTVLASMAFLTELKRAVSKS